MDRNRRLAASQKEKKRVCILTTVHPRDDTRVFFHEACALAERYETILLTADGKQNETVRGVSIRSVIPQPPKNRPERMLKATRIMFREALSLDADVYHFHDTELFPTALRLRRHGKTVIFDAHESIRDTILDRDYLPHWILCVLGKCLGALERYTAQRMDAVVTVTPFLKERYESWGCRTQLVCNFPEIDAFAAGNTAWSRRSCVACYAGVRNDRARGAYEMTEAAQLSGVPLRLFGRVTDTVRQELAAIDTKKIVDFAGTVERSTVIDALCTSQIGMVTEHCTGNARNAYCVKMFEYMAAGMAIVSSNIPLWERTIHENGCGLCVDPTKPEEIAGALEWLRDHPAEAERMGRAGRRAAEETYNWAVQKEALLALYNKLIGDRGS